MSYRSGKPQMGSALHARRQSAGRMKVTGINQPWVADITYIRLKTEFVYLAVILDGPSRKVVGWALERTLASRLAISALERAIADRQPPPGLIHHSDRTGVYMHEFRRTARRKNWRANSSPKEPTVGPRPDSA